MASNIPFSVFREHYLSLTYSSHRLTVVEYARRGGIYSHFTGRLHGRLTWDYIADTEFLVFRLHVGETFWSGFPASHELQEFNLSSDAQCNASTTSFETVGGDGSIGILHGFRRDGWPVDIISTGHVR